MFDVSLKARRVVIERLNFIMELDHSGWQPSATADLVVIIIISISNICSWYGTLTPSHWKIEWGTESIDLLKYPLGRIICADRAGYAETDCSHQSFFPSCRLFLLVAVLKCHSQNWSSENLEMKKCQCFSFCSGTSSFTKPSNNSFTFTLNSLNVIGWFRQDPVSLCTLQLSQHYGIGDPKQY